MKGSWDKGDSDAADYFLGLLKSLSHCCSGVLSTINKHFCKTCNMALALARRRSWGEPAPLSGHPWLASAQSRSSVIFITFLNEWKRWTYLRCGLFFFFFNKFIYFIYFYLWLHCVSVAVRRLSLVAASGGYSWSRCTGFSLWWLLLLQGTGSRCAGFSSCGSRAQ